MQMLKSLLLTVFILGQGFGLFATNIVHNDSLTPPTVFMIGEHEAAFNNLSLEYQTLLLTVCDDNMDMAYDKWLGMLEEMEAFSNLTNFDLKGVKMWINIFWAKDGSIKHIVYHLKPQSRNIDTRYLTAFLSEFAKNYRFPLVYEEKYFHYGLANFPVFPRRLGNGNGSVPVNQNGSGKSLQNIDNRELVKERK